MKKKGKKKFPFRIISILVIPTIFLIFNRPLLSIIFFFLGLIEFFVIVRKRGYLMKDKKGKKVNTKEFFRRWKKGIEGITPLQQTKTSLLGNWIVLSGIISGMVINALVRMENQWWWIEIILGGSLILVVIQMISTIQKYWRLKEVDKQMKELEKTRRRK